MNICGLLYRIPSMSVTHGFEKEMNCQNKNSDLLNVFDAANEIPKGVLLFDVCRICHKELEDGVCGNQNCIGG